MGAAETQTGEQVSADYIPPEVAKDTPAPSPTKPPLSLSASQTPKPWHAVALPSLSFAGVQLAWAVLIGHATAHLRKLGLSDRAVGLAWLAGPVTGTLVQPVVGALSDGCTSRHGRRRPFMLAGSVLTFFGLVLFSQAGEIAGLLGDPVKKRGGGSRTGLGIGIVSFWVVDFAVNFLQTPTRALLADVVPVGQLALGSSFFAVASGFGKGIGYALGAFSPSIREAFAAAGCVVVLLTVVTCMFVEERAVDPAEAGKQGVGQMVRDTIGRSVAAVWEMPRGVGRVFWAQWLTYLGFMYLFIYGCDWVGRDVFGGDGDAAPGSKRHRLFEEGVRFGNVGLLCMALLSMVLAPVTPWAARKLGVRRVWASALVLMGAAFTAAPWAGRATAGVLFASASAAVCAALTIPWAVVSAAVARKGGDRAVLLATFNLSQATPGVVASATGGLLVHAGGGSLTGPMVGAGVCALLAACAVALVDVAELGGAGGAADAPHAGGLPAGGARGHAGLHLDGEHAA